MKLEDVTIFFTFAFLLAGLWNVVVRNANRALGFFVFALILATIGVLIIKLA